MKLIPCEKCGCTGIHACIGVKYNHSEDEIARQNKQLSELSGKLKKLKESVAQN